MPYDNVYSEKRTPGALRTVWRNFYGDAMAMIGLYGCGGLVLLSLAFTLSAQGKAPMLLVGCLQGSPDAAVRDAIRDATKELFGLRPRQLLLVALKAIARAYGLSGIVGISDRLHVYRHWRKRRRIMQSYDEMWQDLGGTRRDDGLFELPLMHQQRALTDYPSNKRSAMARRWSNS